MQKFLFLLFLFPMVFLNAQNARSEVEKQSTPSSESFKRGAFINVNTPEYLQSNFTVEELIKNVLISGITSCSGSVSEVKVRPNHSPSTGLRSYGYFNKGTTDFPFDEGIVLMTGQAKYAGNFFSYGPLKGKLYTKGDEDLSKAIEVYNPLLIDATYIKFDFVPVTNRVSFSYIFASEEYDGFACSYSDGFAFLIKKDGDNDYTNLALLPDNGIPVSVPNVHFDTEDCVAQNPKYYEGDNELEIETNFAGRTIPLTATAVVIPGQTYHFKMVIADFRDTLFDSAVFLKAGSFNIGVHLSDENGNTLPDVINLCQGKTQIMNAGLQIPGSTYQWYFNGNSIAGATSPTYTATQSGTYRLEVLAPNVNCPLIVQVEVDIAPTPIITVTAVNTTICAGDEVYLLASGAKVYSFAGLPGSGSIQIVTPTVTTTYTVTGETSYGCQGNTASLTITVVPKPVSALADIEFCKGSSAILDAGAGPDYTYLWSTGETTQKITVVKDGVYTVIIKNGPCSETFSATVSYIPVPLIEEVIYDKNTLTVKVKDAQPNLEFSINKGISWQSSNVFTNILPNTSYELYVRVPGDFCSAIAEFFTFFVNNVLTPNADGINDYADFSGVSKYKDFSAVIIDRYGKEIFLGTATDAIWKPNDRQATAPSASYWYQVSWLDPVSEKVIQKNGWILLKNRN